MKVIKSGKAGSAWKSKQKCTGKGNKQVGCNAVLLVEGDDVFNMSNENTAVKKTFMCPECGAFTDLINVPPNIGNRNPNVKEKKIHE